MPAQVLTTVENNFTKGLVTEFTGLNFPENAATDADNCQFSLIGDVSRRLGVNFESNFSFQTLNRANSAVTTYKWNNAGGDGSREMVVTQVGGLLYFYVSSLATSSAPLSSTKLVTSAVLSSFLPVGSPYAASVPTNECSFSDGNGYLFVYHPYLEPFYFSYDGTTLNGASIPVTIRDLVGSVDGFAVNNRPLIATGDAHAYNLANQGWNKDWVLTSLTSKTIASSGSFTMTVNETGIMPILIGDTIFMGKNNAAYPAGSLSLTQWMRGVVVSYTPGVSLTFNATSSLGAGTFADWIIQPEPAFIGNWVAVEGNFPSNADVWWTFKNASGVFDPLTTARQSGLGTGPAPKGYFLLNAFDQERSNVSGIRNQTPVTTYLRPSNGAWFQGRVWYTGVNASFGGGPTSSSSSWSENIYFSQIVQSPAEFGKCYQLNDPTSETLFDLLPTDGGVIQIQGCGSIYKLFSLQNALLVFAANGIWYITGSQGIGFSANDYTIYKLSAVRTLSSTSFVSVNGYPYFWNEEGIYSVEPTKQDNAPDARRNSLEVTPLTVGTILDFYNNIPLTSKRYARGAYNPIDYTIQWIYRDTVESGVTTRYEYNKILNFSTYNKAFFPYTIGTDGSHTINSVVYVSSPGGTLAPEPTFKYVASNGSGSSYQISFAQEYDTNYVDWGSVNYDSYFVTGYKLHGQGQRRFQIPYVYIFSRADEPTSYKIQGLWDYASSGNSGRWSVAQLVNNLNPNFGMIFRRHRIRGQGLVLQLKVTSSDGMPFDIMGWSSFETQNTGI